MFRWPRSSTHHAARVRRSVSRHIVATVAMSPSAGRGTRFMTNGPVEYCRSSAASSSGKHGFTKNAGTSFPLGAFSQRLSRVAGEQDDRDVSRSRLALQILNELPSVTATQRQIGDDDVRVRFPGTSGGLLRNRQRRSLRNRKRTRLWTYSSRVSSWSSTTVPAGGTERCAGAVRSMALDLCR